jgi:DNA-binding response OmpR family regulator
VNVLLVDDEPLVTDAIQKVLRRDGWVVVVAHSLAEAQAAPGVFDVVVADVRLPNGDGRHLRELHEGVPFIVISGFHEVGAGQADFLAKPFTPTQLREKIRAAVGR